MTCTVMDISHGRPRQRHLSASTTSAGEGCFPQVGYTGPGGLGGGQGKERGGKEWLAGLALGC